MRKDQIRAQKLHAIEAVKNGIDMLVADLRGNPEALETAWISVITPPHFTSNCRSPA